MPLDNPELSRILHRMLDTTAAVIETLGGINAVAKLTKRTHDAVWLWRKHGRFPAHTYLLLNGALRRVDQTARPGLWTMSTGT